MAAVDKYVRVPLAWLASGWFCDLDMRTARVFLAMCAISRMDKDTPEGQVRTSMRSIGRETNMSTSTVKDAVDELARRGLATVLTEGCGRVPATYLLVVPDDAAVENFAFGDHEGTANTNRRLCSEVTSDYRTQAAGAVENAVENGGGRTQTAVCVRQSRVNGERLIYSPEGENHPKVLPPSGTGGDDLRSEADCGLRPPRCPRCSRPMRRTNTFMPGGRRRVWRCGECAEEAAFEDAALAQPAFAAPSPRQGRPAGGQDRATAYCE